MEFRKSELLDVNRIMEIINQAKQALKSSGIDQWQHGYPNETVIKEDIQRGESYVITYDGTIVGTLALTFHEEEHYNTLRGGSWLNAKKPYAVIRRIAVDDTCKGKGIAGALMTNAEQEAQNLAYSIRIDTHKDNLPMQRAIRKHGFELCGTITLRDGAERLTFEKFVRTLHE